MNVLLAVMPAIRVLGSVAKLAGLLALAAWSLIHLPLLTSSGNPGQEILFSLAIAAAICGAIFVLWTVLLPWRLALLRFVCQLLIRAGYGFLVFFGVWELLSVGIRIQKSGVPDFTGLEALHKAYDSADGLTQAKMLAVVCTLQGSQQSAVHQAAVLFLDAVEA